MSHATQKTWRVFSSEERKIIQGIFEGKGFSNKDLFEVKKTLRDCLIAMIEYRQMCSVLKGSEFVIKSQEQMQKIKEAEAKLESFGALTEGDFRRLTVLLVHKSTKYSHHTIETAVREAISV